MNDKGLFPKSL